MRHKRHFTDRKRVLFISNVMSSTQVVAIAETREWADRIAAALNATDPLTAVEDLTIEKGSSDGPEVEIPTDAGDAPVSE